MAMPHDHQRRRGPHRRADQHDPVGTAPTELLDRRGHVGVDPRIRARPSPGAAEPLEVKGERLVTPAGRNVAPTAATYTGRRRALGEHQAGVAAAQDDPDQHRACGGSEPERPRRPDLAQAWLVQRGGGRGGKSSR
jgi:hypothetical protein